MKTSDNIINLKRILLSFLKCKPFNIVVILIGKIVKVFLPNKYFKYIHKLPVNKKIHLCISDNHNFIFYSKGNDSIADEIYWGGGYLFI